MKYYFGDNREYGAEDIKRALGTLVARSGIELGLSDNTRYDVSALNRIIAAAVTRGVITDNISCLRLEKKGEGYVINPGKGVFADGGIVEIEEEASVEISRGQYLYIAYNKVLDDVYFLTAEQEQTEGGGVLLIPIARVENNGDVTDRRIYAAGKVPALPALSWNMLREVEFVVDDSTITYGSIASGGYIEARHPIDGDMNFMMVQRQQTIGVIHIKPQGATHSFIVGASSRNFGSYDNYIGVEYSSNGYYRATYLDSGPGYISLRYYFPKGNPTAKRFAYKALIGIEA